MKSILDPTFRYTSSDQTDVRKTFARIRRELKARSAVKANEQARPFVTVVAMNTTTRNDQRGVLGFVAMAQGSDATSQFLGSKHGHVVLA